MLARLYAGELVRMHAYNIRLYPEVCNQCSKKILQFENILRIYVAEYCKSEIPSPESFAPWYAR
jgi:hypothetical protein